MPITAARLRIPRPVAQQASIPAPTGGWNARDSIANMDKMDAVVLTNFFPLTTDVMVRQGYSQYTTGLGGQAQSLMVYAGGASTALFVATDLGNIKAVVSGTATATASVSSLTNGKFEYVNFTTAGGSYLIAVNGADKARYYTGSTWAKDGDGAPYDVTVLNTANATNVNVHKGRIWYTEANTLKAYYMPTGAIGGAATAFDLSSVAQMGGYLMAMGTWTIDAGYGVDDLAVWMTSQGEIIVYRGTDPASSATWALVGVWRVGSPVGRRCMLKYAGDLLVISQDGVLPLSSALQSSRTNPRVALTDKIQSAMSEAVSNYGANFGWQLAYYPKANQLYLNVPISAGSQQQQFVMNTISKSWCNFTGWEANCFEVYNDQLYFGGNGVVCKAWYGWQDNGSSIQGDGLQAFGYYGSPGRVKRATMVRPTVLANGTPASFANVAVDFDILDNSSTITATAGAFSAWDSGLWDAATWSTGLVPFRTWQSANTIGTALAPRVKVAANGFTARWASTDIVYERGGVL